MADVVNSSYGKKQAQKAYTKGGAAVLGSYHRAAVRLATLGMLPISLPVAIGLNHVAKTMTKSIDKLKRESTLAKAKAFAAQRGAEKRQAASHSLNYGPGAGGLPGAPGAPGGPLYTEANRRAADPTDAGFHTWDRVTHAMEQGSMHPRAEAQLSSFQTAMRRSLTVRGEIRQRATAYLNAGAAKKAETRPEITARRTATPAATAPGGNGMVSDYTRRDGTRVTGYKRSF